MQAVGVGISEDTDFFVAQPGQIGIARGRADGLGDVVHFL